MFGAGPWRRLPCDGLERSPQSDTGFLPNPPPSLSTLGPLSSPASPPILSMGFKTQAYVLSAKDAPFVLQDIEVCPSPVHVEMHARC